MKRKYPNAKTQNTLTPNQYQNLIKQYDINNFKH